jgi:hypothetical protein
LCNTGRVGADVTGGAIGVSGALWVDLFREEAITKVARRAGSAGGLAVGVVVALEAADRVDALLTSDGAVRVDRALCLDAVIRLADTAAAGLVASAVGVLRAGLVAVSVDAILTGIGCDAVGVEDALVATIRVGQAEPVLAGLAGGAVGIGGALSVAESIDASTMAALIVELADWVAAIGDASVLGIIAADAVVAGLSVGAVGVGDALRLAAGISGAIGVGAIGGSVLIVVGSVAADLIGGLLDDAGGGAAVTGLLVGVVALLTGV